MGWLRDEADEFGFCKAERSGRRKSQLLNPLLYFLFANLASKPVQNLLGFNQTQRFDRMSLNRYAISHQLQKGIVEATRVRASNGHPSHRRQISISKLNYPFPKIPIRL